MNKRGENPLFILFTVLLAITVGAILMSVAQKIGSNEIFERDNLAKDVALAVDTLQAAPGDVLYTVVRNTTPFLIKMEKGEVSVKQSGAGLVTSTSQRLIGRSAPIAERFSPDLLGTSDHEPLLFVQKKGFDITFAFCEDTKSTRCTDPASRIIALGNRLQNEVVSAFEECHAMQGDLCSCGSFSTDLITKNSKLTLSSDGGKARYSIKSGTLEAKRISDDFDFCERFYYDSKTPRTFGTDVVLNTEDEDLPERYTFERPLGSTHKVRVPVIIRDGNKVCILSQLPGKDDYVFDETGISYDNGKVLIPACGAP